MLVASRSTDQRIANDVGQLVETTLALGLGLLSSLASLGSFTVILWQISRRIPISIYGHAVQIPGFLLWVAVAFSLIATLGAHLIGAPLSGLMFKQQRYEADFRYALVRVRENAEPIALIGGEAAEDATLAGLFRTIVGNWHAIMRRQKTLTFFTSGYAQVAVVLPYVVIAPRYFDGRIPLGTLTQTAGAFGQVQTAFSYFVTAYTSLAQWRAIVDRRLR